MATQIGVRVARERAVFRRWQRFRLNLPIRVVVTRDKSTRITSGRAHDISDGGVLVFAGTELHAGDEVLLEFTAPFSNEAVRAKGLIRHRKGYNYGVEFLHHTAEDHAHAERMRALLRLAAGNLQS